jgi:hypothetical protein
LPLSSNPLSPVESFDHLKKPKKVKVENHGCFHFRTFSWIHLSIGIVLAGMSDLRFVKANSICAAISRRGHVRSVEKTDAVESVVLINKRRGTLMT